MDTNNFNKGLKNSLKFLDNEMIYWIIVIILFLYNTCIFMNINEFFSNMYEFGIVRVIVLLLVLYTSQKSYLIALLLAMSYIISIYFDKEKITKENFLTNMETENNFDNYNTEENNMHTEDNFDNHNTEENNMHTEDNFVNHNNTIKSDEESIHHEEESIHDKKKIKYHKEKLKYHKEKLKHHEEESKTFTENFKSEKKSDLYMNNFLDQTKCLQNYNPDYEKVGDVCEPVATFEGEYNAQGLNYPIGYNFK